MRTGALHRPLAGVRIPLAAALLLTVLVLAGQSPSAAGGEPTSDVGFSKAFAPDTIGPGSTSKLTFTIDNTKQEVPTLVTDLAFTDVLPAGTALADPPNAATDCTNGVLTTGDAPDSISLAGARLGAGAACTVTVDVVGTSTGAHLNVSGDLTSSDGNSGNATDTLTVTDWLPGVSKAFDPPTIPAGGTSTLTFTIDNGINQGSLYFLSLADELPAGLVVAAPPNATTDCGGGSSFTLTVFAPAAGSTTVNLLSQSFSEQTPVLGGGQSCTASVDVTTDTAGTYLNRSFELESASAVFGTTTPSGFATAALEVPVEFLAKAFTDDPVVPGGQVTLEFRIQNPSRDFAATSIAFTDTIDPLGSLTGLAPGETLPKAACGGTLDFAAGALSFSGGSLAAGVSCTATVLLDVPGDAPTGSFTNTTSAITADIDGAGVEASGAADDLAVSVAPTITKEFVDDPVAAGGSATLRFTITNNNPDSYLPDLEFTDDLNTAIPGLAANGLVSAGLPDPVADVCGGGSELTVSSPPANPTILNMTGGFLAAAGTAGDTCTFDVVVDVPAGTPAGIYTNTTSQLAGNFDTCGDGCLEPTTGEPASGDLVVVGAPRLTKEFIDDPAQPGGTVTLRFSLLHSAFAAGDATAVTFTDDLAATLTGLTAASGASVADLCGTGNGALAWSAGDALLTVSGVTLTPGQLCTFDVTLNVPGVAPGSYPNTTSPVTATVAGLAGLAGIVGNAATDSLRVAGLMLTKEFTDDPVIAGGNVTLRFTIDNINPTANATAITFEDVLDPVVLPGLTVAALPAGEPCGTGSSFVTFDPPGAPVEGLRLTGGSLLAGESCTSDVTLAVPAGTVDSQYPNATQGFEATIDGASPPTAFDNASDKLVVDSTLIELTKEFTDDPVAPGDEVTLEFEIINVSPTETVTDISFSDDLDATLSGLTVLSAVKTCADGMASGIGTGLFGFDGASLAPGASCTITATLDVPGPAVPGRVFPNTTSEVTGKVDTLDVFGNPATDDLVVQTVTFDKSFAGPVPPGGTGVLTFTIENLDSVSPLIDLGFTDDLDAVVSGLEAVAPLPAAPCGPGSALAGTSLLNLTGGNLPAAGTCAFDVTVAVPVTADFGNYVNLTSALSNSGLTVAEPAIDTLTVVPNNAFTATDGARFADTRSPFGTTFDGQFAAAGRRNAGSTYEVTIAGRGAVPANAVGVIANVTAVQPSDDAFFTVFPCGPLPIASAVNYATGVDVANEVFAKLSPTGSVCVYTYAETDLIIDVVGFVVADDVTELVTPARLAESREGAPTVDGLMEGFGRTADGSVTTVQITGRGGVPAGTPTAILNVAAVDPTDTSFLTVYPCQPTVPLASSVNYTTAGVNRANELIAELSDDGEICIYTDKGIDLLVDVTGYITPGSNYVGNGPSRFVDTRDGATTIDGQNQGGGKLLPGSTTTVQITGRDAVPANAITAVVNVAAVDPDAAGYFTVTGCVTPLPLASSLNYTAGVNGANELVVDLNGDGELCVYTSASTQLLVDVVGYQFPIGTPA